LLQGFLPYSCRVFGAGTSGRGGHKRIWWTYLVFIYENRRMKPVDIVLGRRWEEEREQWRGEI
jgi:hypothetical protein